MNAGIFSFLGRTRRKTFALRFLLVTFLFSIPLYFVNMDYVACNNMYQKLKAHNEQILKKKPKASIESKVNLQTKRAKDIVETSENVFYGCLIGLPILAMLLLLPSIITRVHDMNKENWWTCIALIPVVGTLWLLFAPGTQGPNSFGNDPRGAHTGGFGTGTGMRQPGNRTAHW